MFAGNYVCMRICLREIMFGCEGMSYNDLRLGILLRLHGDLLLCILLHLHVDRLLDILLALLPRRPEAYPAKCAVHLIVVLGFAAVPGGGMLRALHTNSFLCLLFVEESKRRQPHRERRLRWRPVMIRVQRLTLEDSKPRNLTPLTFLA
jgi:hypothetical protein